MANGASESTASVASMFINGEWVDAISGRTFAVTNPATGERLGDVPDGGADDAR